MKAFHFPSLLACALLAGLLTVSDQPLAADSAEARGLLPSRINGRFLLLNHFGETVTDRSFGDRFQLIYFGYTHCPDVCPSALATVNQALAMMGEKAEQVQPLMISVDPERDTPEVLREFVRYFHPRLVGLTGTPQMLERVAQNFRIRYEKVRLPDDPPDVYRIDHSAGIYFMGPQGEFLVKFAYSATAEQMAKRMLDFIP
ncbi:MAG: hypothetical protein Kow006_16490 [Gammaproteobacteria bacterium]